MFILGLSHTMDHFKSLKLTLILSCPVIWQNLFGRLDYLTTTLRNRISEFHTIQPQRWGSGYFEKLLSTINSPKHLLETSEWLCLCLWPRIGDRPKVSTIVSFSLFWFSEALWICCRLLSGFSQTFCCTLRFLRGSHLRTEAKDCFRWCTKEVNLVSPPPELGRGGNSIRLLVGEGSLDSAGEGFTVATPLLCSCWVFDLNRGEFLVWLS